VLVLVLVLVLEASMSPRADNRRMHEHPCFDHEKLDVYRLLRIVSMLTKLLERLLGSGALG
jgi:hypothetical protein